MIVAVSEIDKVCRGGEEGEQITVTTHLYFQDAGIRKMALGIIATLEGGNPLRAFLSGYIIKT